MVWVSSIPLLSHIWCAALSCHEEVQPQSMPSLAPTYPPLLQWHYGPWTSQLSFGWVVLWCHFGGKSPKCFSAQATDAWEIFPPVHFYDETVLATATPSAQVQPLGRAQKLQTKREHPCEGIPVTATQPTLSPEEQQAHHHKELLLSQQLVQTFSLTGWG